MTATAKPYVANVEGLSDGPAHPNRFTRDGDETLEEHLTATCERIARGLRGLVPASKLEAVLLGGGYGRGEGGVLRTPQGDRPYNDLEFYVCIRGNRHWNERRFGRALHTLGEILTPQAGIEVEFRITSLRELERAQISMFSYDLVSGHRWLIGNDSALRRCGHHLDAPMIPVAEATRLLMNRASGLLFAAERLERSRFTAADADFVARNIAKAQLGAGDAVLTAYGEYDWSVRERHRRLQRLARLEDAAWLHDAVGHHHAGTEFKLHPTRENQRRDQLAGWHAQVSDFCRQVWLWLEAKRLRQPLPSVSAYVNVPVKCPESRRLRNALVNLKVLGLRATLASDPLRHPRERVLTALPILLWQRDKLDRSRARERADGEESPLSRAGLQVPSEATALLQRELNTAETSIAGLVAAYRELWSRVN